MAEPKPPNKLPYSKSQERRLAAQLPEPEYEADALGELDAAAEWFEQQVERTAIGVARMEGRNLITVQDVRDAETIVVESKYPPRPQP